MAVFGEIMLLLEPLAIVLAKPTQQRPSNDLDRFKAKWFANANHIRPQLLIK